MVGRFDNIHPGLSCDQARNILGLPIDLLESQSDLYMAAAHLINCPGVETEKVLIGLLERDSSEQAVLIAKRKAVDTLARLQCSSAIPAIGQCLFSPDTYLVENAAWALSQLHCSSQKLQDQMIALLDDPSQNHRILIQSLAGLNAVRALGSISRFQQDPSPGVKGAAISAAVTLSGKASNLDVLAEHLFLPNQMDRQCAVQDIIDAKADSLLPQVLKAPVSPVFRMRALRLLFPADQSEKPSRQVLDWVDLVIQDDPLQLELVHQYDQDPAVDFLVAELFNPDFSRCYLALRTLLAQPAECLFPVLQEAWEREAHNDYGAHYFFVRLFGLKPSWSPTARDWIIPLLVDAVTNPRPQFLKSCHAAVLSLAALEPCVLLELLPGLFNGSARVGWEVRYAIALASPLLKAVDKSGVADQFNQHLLADPDGFVSRRFGLSIDNAS